MEALRFTQFGFGAIMTRTAPPPPNRGSFYTIVCGGTWLDREKYNQAVADFKGDDLRHGDFKDAMHFASVRKMEGTTLAEQAYLQTLQRPPRPLLPPLLASFEPFAQGVQGFLARLAPAAQAAEKGLPVELQANPAKREGLLAQLFASFLGNRREVQQLKVSKEEQEQRNATDFELAASDLFSLGKIAAPQGRSGMGGDQQPGQ
jgi:hypothetical protein